MRLAFWNRRDLAPGESRQEVPVWLLLAVLLALAVGWHISANANYLLILGTVSSGIAVTIKVSAIAFTLALVLGFGLGLMRVSSNRVLREISTFYVEIVRGVPMLVILYYIAFVAAPSLVDAFNWATTPLIDAGWTRALTIRDFGFTERAILALSLGYASFLAEIFRAGFESIPHGQMEAAFSLGMSRRQAMMHVVLPQGFRNVLPALGNDFVAMIKDSALVSALGVQDITQAGKVFASGSFQFFETYNVVAYLYLTLTVTLSLIIRFGEDRMKRHQRSLSSLR